MKRLRSFEDLILDDNIKGMILDFLADFFINEKLYGVDCMKVSSLGMKIFLLKNDFLFLNKNLLILIN